MVGGEQHVSGVGEPGAPSGRAFCALYGSDAGGNGHIVVYCGGGAGARGALENVAGAAISSRHGDAVFQFVDAICGDDGDLFASSGDHDVRNFAADRDSGVGATGSECPAVGSDLAVSRFVVASDPGTGGGDERAADGGGDSALARAG